MNNEGLKRMTAIISAIVSVVLITRYMARFSSKEHNGSRRDSCGNHDHNGNGHKKCSCHQLIPKDAGSALNGFKDCRTVNLHKSMNGEEEYGERTAEILKNLTREIREISF